MAHILSTMMAKSPDDRFQSCAEVAEALEPFCDQMAPPSSVLRSARGKSTGPTSSVRAKQPASEKSSRVLRSQDAPAEPSEPPSQTSASSVKSRPKSQAVAKPKAGAENGTAGILLLIGGILLFLLLIGGVVGFLVFGPSPNAALEAKKQPDPEEQKPKKKFEMPLPKFIPPVQTTKALLTLTGHTEGVERLAYSADGKKIVSGGKDKTVRIWDLATQKCELTLTNHTGIVNWVEFNPKGDRLLSASADGTARLWELPSGKELRVFDVKKRVWVATFGRTESEVLTAGDDFEIKFWNADNGAFIRAIAGHSNTINSMARIPGRFAPNQAITASWDGSLRTWDLDRGNVMVTLIDKIEHVRSVVTDRAGRKALSSGKDGIVRLWDLESSVMTMAFSDRREDIYIVALDPEGTFALAGGVGNKLYRWKISEQRFVQECLGHTGPITGLAVAPDGKTFASGSEDKTLRIWNVEENQ